jgi:hypothetical protein
VGADKAAATTTTDNQLIGGTGDDVFVLSTVFSTGGVDEDDLLDSSNEVLVYTGAFGNDTVFNFGADGGLDADNSGDDALGDDTFNDGEDVLDFTGVGGDLFDGAWGAGGGVIDDGDIYVDDNDLAEDADGNPAQPLLADIEDLFDDDDTADEDDTAIYIEVSADNVGYVYQVVDGPKDNDLKVTYLGSIDLADTDWFDLTGANFAG